MAEIPERGTPEFEWWVKGAEAEAHARRENVPDHHREALDLYEALLYWGERYDPVELLVKATHIMAANENFWGKLKLAWRILR